MRLPLSGNCQMGAPALVVSDDGYFKYVWMDRGLFVVPE